jgi:hypothetical protein
MGHDAASVELDKSVAANDEQVAIRALFNAADGNAGKDGFETIPDKAVEARTGADPQNAVAGAVKPSDLIAHARPGVIEDG